MAVLVALSVAGTGDGMRWYARMPGQAALVPVRDSATWPDSLESSFGVAVDGEGHIVQVAEIPTSKSGDWSNVYTHYFDAEGRTRGFVRESLFLNGCPRPGAREHTQSRAGGRDFRLFGALDFDGDSRMDARCSARADGDGAHRVINPRPCPPVSQDAARGSRGGATGALT